MPVGADTAQDAVLRSENKFWITTLATNEDDDDDYVGDEN